MSKNVKNIIIGFGKGGKTIAAYLGTQGEETVLIEKSPVMYGGTCINVGCIPTKKLQQQQLVKNIIKKMQQVIIKNQFKRKKL